MMKAIEFGEEYGSCEGAMIWRRSLGPEATQADAWLACDRGDWLRWQLEQEISSSQYTRAFERAMEQMIDRAIRRAQQRLQNVQVEWEAAWRRWACRWLSGEDRSEEAAYGVARVVEAAKKAKGPSKYAEKITAIKAIKAAKAAEYAAMGALWMGEVMIEVKEGADNRIAELRFQAQDIRREIPVWPGE